MAKSYVKALYDYHSDEATDLSFTAGAVIQVLNQVDENWIKGEYDGNVGLFPTNFVEPFIAPDADKDLASNVGNTSGRTVVAKETYISGDDDVLTFFRGDELMFLGRVDSYWCNGSLAGKVGLFPAHMVEGLDNVSSSPQINNVSRTSPSMTEARHQRTVTTKPTSLQEAVVQPSIDEPHAKTLFAFNGLSDFELSFPVNAFVKLTKDVDSEWFEGVYGGNVGIFPKSFVEVLVPLPQSHSMPRQALEKDWQLYNGQMDNVITDALDVPYAIAVYPFVGETSSELSFRAGDTIFLYHWVSPEWIQGECNGHVGIFPSTFVQIEKELPQDFEELSRGTVEELPQAQEEIVNSLFNTGDKALAIYNYATDIDGDLHLEVGDLILIEQIIDKEWVLGRKGESVGLCPAVFLEPPADKLNSDYHNDSGQSNEIGLVNVESFSPLKNGESTSISAESKGGHVSLPENILSTSGSGYVPISSLEKSVDSGSTNVPSTGLGRNAPKVTTAPDIHVTPTSPVAVTLPEQPKGESLNRTTTNALHFRSPTSTVGSKPPLAPKPHISPKPDFLKKPVKPVSLPIKPVLPPKPVAIAEKSPTFKSPETKWVTFEDQNESPMSTKRIEARPKPTPPLRKKLVKDPSSMSYKALLDKSQSEDLISPTTPETNKACPVPPPRVDLVGSSSFNSDALSSKIMEQAEQFEKSSSRENSPSLNELRELSKSQKPVPVKRTKQPGKSLAEQGLFWCVVCCVVCVVVFCVV